MFKFVPHRNIWQTPCTYVPYNKLNRQFIDFIGNIAIEKVDFFPFSRCWRWEMGSFLCSISGSHQTHLFRFSNVSTTGLYISLSVCLSFSVYFWRTVAQHLELTARVETMLKVNKKKHHTKPIHTHTESVSSSPSPPPPPHFALSSHIKTLHSIE